MQINRVSSFRSISIYFGLAFLFSWLFWSIGIINSLGIVDIPVPNIVWVIIGINGPLFSAVVLTHRKGGLSAVGQLIRSGFNLRMRAIWWITIILLPTIFGAAAVWINMQFSSYELDTTMLSRPLLIPATFLFMFFLGGSFQEEFGWRGYALPRMLKHWPPILAALVLGGAWGIWHLPLFFVEGTSQNFINFELFFLLSFFFSILFTWIYIKSDRNLFSALLLHTSINTMLAVFPPIEQRAGGNQMAVTYLMLLYGILAVVLVISDRSFWFSNLKAVDQ